MAKSVPVYILTGFLGAGKTTLLQTLLRHSKEQGQRPVVLMNEFGNESVDSVLLQQAAVPVVDLVEGCVCCTVRDSLTMAMLQMVEQYQPDVLFLEATGVARPLEIVDVLFHEELQDLVHLAGVLTLVDTTNFPLSMGLDPSAVQRTMFEQVHHADAILLSKTDLIGFERRLALESFLGELNPDAPQIKVVKGQVDASALLSIRTRQGTGNRRKGHPRIVRRSAQGTTGKPRVHTVTRAGKTSFGTLQTLRYPFRGLVDTDRFYEFLRMLPDTIYRGKGFYRDSEGGYCYEFHYTPGFPMIDPRPDLQGQEAFAIFIGEKLEEQGIRQGLAACEVR